MTTYAWYILGVYLIYDIMIISNIYLIYPWHMKEFMSYVRYMPCINLRYDHLYTKYIPHIYLVWYIPGIYQVYTWYIPGWDLQNIFQVDSTIASMCGCLQGCDGCGLSLCCHRVTLNLTIILYHDAWLMPDWSPDNIISTATYEILWNKIVHYSELNS